MPEAPAEQGPEARLGLLGGVVELLAGAARRRPLLLAFDDLHRADEASLALRTSGNP